MKARRGRKPKQPISEGYLRPTAEREAINPFVSAGAARRIIPAIDLLRAQHKLTADQHRKLAYYREQASLADTSPVRSCCDNSPRGDGHGPGAAILSAKLETSRMNKAMGAGHHIAYAVAVADMSLAQWCILKYGGRERYGPSGKFIAIVPIAERRVVPEALGELCAAVNKLA